MTDKEEVIYKRTYLKSLLDCKEECEKLKSESFTREELITIQEKDIECYRNALEEIERVCLEDTYTFADGTQVRYDTLDDILSIINKLIGN